MDQYEPIPGLEPRPSEGEGALAKGAELDAFLEKTFAPLVPEPSGAAVTVVKDGEIIALWTHGRTDGVANPNGNVTSDTLFHIGSMSKMFTATAVMQLVARKVLNLDADVNTYLSFKVPHATLRNLLTHTGGFEENQLGWMMKEHIADLVPLEASVRAHIPAQVRRPTTDFSNDRAAAYSSWAYALLGCVISHVTEVPFDVYMEREVFSRLGMQRSTFREPLPAGFAPTPPSGGAEPFEKDLFHCVAPAGSMVTTPSDMANFMVAHLNGGTFNGVEILPAEEAHQMQGRALSPHKRVNGGGLGCYELNHNGLRLIGHRGKTILYRSDMYLSSERGVGLFAVIYYPQVTSTKLKEASLAFFSEYFPAEIPQPPADYKYPDTASQYTGHYRGETRGHKSIEKFCLFNSPEKFDSVATLVNPHTLHITNLGGADADWVEMEPGVFRRVGAQDQIVFTRNARGRVEFMLGPFVYGPSRRVRWFDSVPMHRKLFKIGTAGLWLGPASFVAALALWVVNALHLPAPAWLALACSAVFGTLNLRTLPTLQPLFVWMPPAPQPYRYDPAVHATLTRILASLPFLLFGIVCGFALFGSALPAWAGAAIAMTLVLQLVFSLELHFWNLIGYRYG